MIVLEVLLDGTLAGSLSHDPVLNLFSFDYAPKWLLSPQKCALSPSLPLAKPTNQPSEIHSAIVRQFFENLLPEGRALDEASVANNLPKSNLIGLMIALGGETAGALQIRLPGTGDSKPATTRPLLKEELSLRIRSRPYEPFSVWDGKVRLSIAGYQDKISVFKKNDQWFLVDGKAIASTVILKPEPVNKHFSSLPSNELFCMRLAKNVGLSVASVRLVHVPEPVLEVDRFDRVINGTNHDCVRRLHIIDGCQALGMPVSHKYERLYGDNKDVQHIRDGATLPKLFNLLKENDATIVDRSVLLRWTLFQVLIGNTDAHAKNLSFFSTKKGLTIAPAYDLVSILAQPSSDLDTSFAMAIGDAFFESELSAVEWANFSSLCELPPKLVANEMTKLSREILRQLPLTVEEVLIDGAQKATVVSVCDVVQRLCNRHLALAPMIADVDRSEFAIIHPVEPKAQPTKAPRSTGNVR